MGLLSYGMLWLWQRAELAAFLSRVSAFVVMIGVSTAAFLLFAWALRCPEVEEVYGIATRRAEKEAGPPAMME
jgi:hypothetical protein